MWMVPFGEPKSLIGSDGGCVSPFVWRTLAEARLDRVIIALHGIRCPSHSAVRPSLSGWARLSNFMLCLPF